MNDAFKPLIVILLVGVGLGVLVAAPRLMTPKEVVTWRSDLAAARSESVADHKPLLLYFTATWCGPCQEMKRTTFADVEVDRALRAGYVPVKLDVDQNAALARQYGIESIPAFKVLDDEGRAVREESGFMDSKAFLAWLRATTPTSAVTNKSSS